MALSEFYLSLIIIQDYQQYNLIGFKKINKKFDKNLVCELGSQWFASQVKKSDLNNSDEVASLISTVKVQIFILPLTILMRTGGESLHH